MEKAKKDWSGQHPAIMLTFSADEDGEQMMINKLNAARDKEYGELFELRKKAEAMLSKCAELLDGFCDKVYEFNEKS